VTVQQRQQVELPILAPLLGPTTLFGNHKQSATAERVTAYFETSGFSRWTAIYGEGGLPPIWRVIREGHDAAIDQVLEWVGADRKQTALDAGCGTGNLSVKLADCGYEVEGFDVSAPMVSFAKYITQGRTRGAEPRFFVGDIAALEGAGNSYDLVCCLDVLFHYPYAEVKEMLAKLAALSTYKIVGSFAISTPMNAFWMQIGQRFFHRKNRMTSLHLLSYDQVEQVLYRAGFRMTRTRRIKRFFYDSFVFEAIRR
jgi:magnesium-protoporphyrin O-methyltransferase